MSLHDSDFSIADRFSSHMSAEDERSHRHLWTSVLYQMIYASLGMDASIQPFEIRASRSYLLAERNKDRDLVLELAGFSNDVWRTNAIPTLERLYSQGKTYSQLGKGRGCKGGSNAITALFSDLRQIGRKS